MKRLSRVGVIAVWLVAVAAVSLRAEDLASSRNLTIVSQEQEGIVTGSVRVADAGLTIAWTGKIGHGAPSGGKGTDGFDYCKMGTGFDADFYVTGETYAFTCGQMVVLGGHYTMLYTSRWYGAGWYRPNGSVYWEEINAYQIPDPGAGNYWEYYNIVCCYDPVPQSWESGSWTAKWFDNGTVVCQKVFTVTTPQVSGYVRTAGGQGIGGVVMGGLPGNPSTQADGSYSVSTNCCWSGTAAPSKAGYTFSPSNKNYSCVNADQVNQGYTGTLQAFTVSGYVRTGGGQGIAGVVMNGFPGTPPSTGVDGYYSASVEYCWSGTVAPSKVGYVFLPVSTAYSCVTANQSNRNYTGAPQTCPINVMASPNPVSATVGASAGSAVSASDPEGDPIQYYLVSGRGSVNSQTGVWSYTPVCADLPGFDVTVKASDKGASDCASSTVTFHVNVAQPYSCSRSGTDPYLLACPKGDILFDVYLRKADGSAATTICSLDDVYLDFASCSPAEFLPQPGLYPNWPRVYAAAQPDQDGVVRFAVAAGGYCADCNVSVYAACGLIATVPVRSVDVDGDAWVSPFDADPSQGNCRDVNADGVIDDADLSRLAAHCCDHRYPTGNCDWLGQKIELVPDAGFIPGQAILIRYAVDNNPAGGSCQIDSVVFYQSEVTVTPTWERVARLAPGLLLLRGSSYRDSMNYTVPAYGNMCLRTLLYSTCCSSPQEAKWCAETGAQCPPGAVCYEFVARDLAYADQIREVSHVPAGWIHYEDTRPPDTTLYVICTDNNTPIGTTGSVEVYYHTASGWNHFDFRVRQDWRNGDMCGGPGGQVDCTINVQDVVCLVNTVFRAGIPPTPHPVQHGDVNCDGIYNVVDVVQLVNYVFRGGAPPPDCGAGPMVQ